MPDLAVFLPALRGGFLPWDDPRLAHAQNNWGITLARQGKWPEALLHYEEALRLNPGYTEARLNLAVALERLGRSTEAQQRIARARASSP